MPPLPNSPSYTAALGLSPADVAALLWQARALQSAWRKGTPLPLLRGKQLGLLRGSGEHDQTALFCHAARELGAHVALLQHGLTESSPEQEVDHTARLMGRLYDAIECQGLSRALVQQIAQAAGVPVFDGLGLPQHASAAWVSELQGSEEGADKQRFLIQAWLLRKLAAQAAP